MKKIMFIIAIMLGLFEFDANDNTVIYRNDVDPNIIFQIYQDEPPKVNWIGSPQICDWDGNWLNEGCIVNYQIGLREDGVVIWRLTP